MHSKTTKDVNVWIHDFDDAKEESKKVVSKDKHCFSRLIQGCFNKQSLASILTQDQALPQNKVFPRHPRLW